MFCSLTGYCSFSGQFTLVENLMGDCDENNNYDSYTLISQAVDLRSSLRSNLYFYSRQLQEKEELDVCWSLKRTY